MCKQTLAEHQRTTSTHVCVCVTPQCVRGVVWIEPQVDCMQCAMCIFVPIFPDFIGSFFCKYAYIPSPKFIYHGFISFSASLLVSIASLSFPLICLYVHLFSFFLLTGKFISLTHLLISSPPHIHYLLAVACHGSCANEGQAGQMGN